jgi:hypothetical protein
MNMVSTLETVAIIAFVVIAVTLAGLYFGGKTVESTGGYISNSTNGSILLGWAGVPIGSFLIDTGRSWIQTAETVTMFIVGLFLIAGIILYYTNKN